MAAGRNIMQPLDLLTMNQRLFFTATFLLGFTATRSVAQVNDKGTFHASIGVAAGAHATEYEQSIVGVVRRDQDGAATVTYPIELGYGSGKRFSLGLCLEPGVYLDSSASGSNGLVSIGIQPRFYIINADRFAWMASVHLGSSALRYDVKEPGNVSDARYRGANFGISTGVGFYFGEHFGLNILARYIGTRMPLREWTVNGTELDPT